MKRKSLLLLFVCLTLLAHAVKVSVKNAVDFVNPLVGSDGQALYASSRWLLWCIAFLSNQTCSEVLIKMMFLTLFQGNNR